MCNVQGCNWRHGRGGAEKTGGDEHDKGDQPLHCLHHNYQLNYQQGHCQWHCILASPLRTTLVNIPWGPERLFRKRDSYNCDVGYWATLESQVRHYTLKSNVAQRRWASGQHWYSQRQLGLVFNVSSSAKLSDSLPLILIFSLSIPSL